MPVEIILPAYNINPVLARKHEAKIATFMHRQRNVELNRTADLPDDSPMRKAPRLRSESKPTQSNRDKPLVPTDKVLLALLKGQKLTSTEIMRATGLNRDTLRAALLRLSSRGLLIKEVRGNHITWHTVGEQTHVEEA